MKPGEIFAKTMPFAWAKLLLGLATIVISIVIFAILMGIAWLFKSDGVFLVMFIIWICATGAVNFFINHYIGYLVKAGHVAVITEAVTTGSVPDNQIAYGKEMVKERFLTSNIYFVIDKLVSGSVKQIQRGVEKIGNKMGNLVPGMNFVTNIAKMFVGIALGYIDECCLGYTFYKKKQGAFKSAADGVVIYAQNWKTLLKDAAKTTAMVIILVIVVTLIAFALFGFLFRLFKWESGLVGFVAFLLACFFAVVVKRAFIDSYILVSMMTSYMGVAPSTTITFDLYNKLCGISAKFKELFNKGQEEKGSGKSKAEPDAPAKKGKAVFCGECGAKNESGTKFCGSCGKKL
jgi:hypothetical protein